jgi:hypothetical protein
MRRTRRKRTGGSLLALFLCLCVPRPGLGEQKPEPAVIAGTVFRDPGFAFPGAEVEVQPVSPPGPKKAKRSTVKTDARGEFAFQVPPEPGEYRVTARARGYRPEERVVKLSGGPERHDIYLTLKPAGSEEK